MSVLATDKAVLWQQIICRTQKSDQAALSDALDSAGAVSITYQDAADQPVLEPLPGETPLWDDIIITGLFKADSSIAPILFNLRDNPLWQLKSLHTEVLEEQNWERAWMKDFHPMQFGKNLWIYPSWADIPNDDSVKILLDPGLAFGTGTHPTTALCLEWLDQYPPIDKQVIDYGCGSGVLAVAAAKLGAKSINATDIDPQALLATADNMQRNQIDPALIRHYLPEQLPQYAADLLLANILSGPLVELADTLLNLVKPSGYLVLSGILVSQKEAILSAYSAQLSQIELKQSGDWLRISGKRL
jgi:ribosomal protein L11 methyltransferase